MDLYSCRSVDREVAARLASGARLEAEEIVRAHVDVLVDERDSDHGALLDVVGEIDEAAMARFLARLESRPAHLGASGTLLREEP